MLPKTPKPQFWKFVKGSAKTLFLLEAVGFAACYGVYYRMNTNRDFRLYINENYPFVLEYYYKVGELLGENKIRQTDSSYWNAASQKKQE